MKDVTTLTAQSERQISDLARHGERNPVAYEKFEGRIGSHLRYVNHRLHRR